MLMNEGTTETERGFLIDPFAAVPGEASRIDGLRAGVRASEPGYVFRTSPIMPVPGPTEFAVRFDDLRADAGRLSLDLTATAAYGHAAPVKVKTLVVPLGDLAARDGMVAIAFDARRDTLYAVAGYVHDEAAAAARQLSVELRTVSPEPLPHRPDLARATVEPAELPRLASLDEPDFGAPVSQPMTPAQCRHPDYRRWVDGLRASGATSGDRLWMPAFVLQVLDRYGVLRPGARGFGLGVVDAPLLAQLRAAGCVVTAEDRGKRGPVDFVWSIDAATSSDDLDRAVKLGIDCLAAGGFGIHVVGFGETGVPRSQIERLALNLISHGHHVAQLKFRTSGKGPMLQRENIPYGLVWRRT